MDNSESAGSATSLEKKIWLLWSNRFYSKIPLLTSNLKRLLEITRSHHVPLRHIRYTKSKFSHFSKILNLSLLFTLGWLQTFTEGQAPSISVKRILKRFIISWQWLVFHYSGKLLLFLFFASYRVKTIHVMIYFLIWF